MTRPQIFFAAVVALYAFVFLRWALGKLRAWVGIRAERLSRTFAEMKSQSQKHQNPFTPRPDPIDYVADRLRPLLSKVGALGDDPIMREKINDGSEKFFKAEEEAAGPLIQRRHSTVLRPSAELEAVRDLWPKSVHQSRESRRLPDVRKPTDPGDGSLES